MFYFFPTTSNLNVLHLILWRGRISVLSMFLNLSNYGEISPIHNYAPLT